MRALLSTALLVVSSLGINATFAAAQSGTSATAPSAGMKTAAAPQSTPAQTPEPPQPSSHAPHMSKQTRYQIIRDFETQVVYARTSFPMGTKGLILKDGIISPNGMELQQSLALYGPAVKPGDPAQISYVQIKDNHIHFEINGGPIRRKKWYNHIEISGANGPPMSPGGNEAPPNPHGTYVDLYFDRYVPELSAKQLREILLPVLDFNARNKEQAYLDTVPPKVKEAILAHHVLVGMNSEMVVHAKGRPPKKDREKDGNTEYEEWIYGEPPDDVDFVRLVNDQVVRVETMKVGGQKILRTEKEIELTPPDQQATAAKEEPQEHPANAPSLRRPGEDTDDVPKPAGNINPNPPISPPDMPGPPGNGPGTMVAAR
jgi:hypothetical protein